MSEETFDDSEEWGDPILELSDPPKKYQHIMFINFYLTFYSFNK